MAGTPIERLQLSVRACNVLYRIGIHNVEALIKTPLEDIAQQRNIGAKTLSEIKYAIENADYIIEHVADFADDSVQDDTAPAFTDEQLSEMFRHPIEELGLSARPLNALHREGYLTIDKVAQLSEVEFSQMKGLGKKSVDEIKETVATWIKDNISFGSNLIQYDVEPEIKEQLQLAATEIDPVMHLYWKQLYDALIAAGSIEQIRNFSRNDVVKRVLQLPETQNKFRAFWSKTIHEGMISEDELTLRLSELPLSFSPSILIDAALITGILMSCNNIIMISRDIFLDAFEKICDPDDRAAQILQFRTEGESLQDIGDLFELTRERVRQITVKLVRKFPLLFEDYFSGPFQHFRLLKTEFCRAFPDVTKEGYEYLSIRYQRGKIPLTSESLSEYNGMWKAQLDEFLREKEVRDDKKTVSRTETVMRVLISNADNSLSIDEFVDEYYRYIEKRGYPVERLKINLRSVGNHLRNAKGVVFNRENKVRFCDAAPHAVWEIVDFSQYKNTVISSELIFRNYQDEMEELDIRDGYELFYIIKSSLPLWHEKQFSIRCRRVPVIIFGDGSEAEQAIKLLKEISPVAYLDYYEAYEERFGVRKESAQGNPVVTNVLSAYYIDGQYIIDVPAIDERDVPQVLAALSEKPLWFIEDIEELFDKVCKYTSHDAINAAAFHRIGYTLHSSYAYSSSYGTALNFFDEVVFSKDVVNLTMLDRRMVNLQIFATALDKKKRALEYIETAPKVLMSIAKVRDAYNLSIEEIKEMQSLMSIFYDTPFFNGRSIWTEVEYLPLVQKLQGNDWMLTCIMRQQEAVASLSVAGGIILSLENTTLSLSRICEWIATTHGKMSITGLEREFNDIFGTRISASKLAEKLKTSGSWDKVVTDSMDEYIDNLVDAGLSDIDADDLLQEEFF